MKDLKGKTAVITGAASGIGSSFAIELAKEGMNLSISDINMEGLEETKKEIEKLGVKVISSKCDVTKYQDMENLAREVHSELGDVDLLINNAGIVRYILLEDIDLDDFKRVLDVNLWGIVHSLKAFLPKMLERKSGHIVNIGSGAGIIGAAEPLPYVASKFSVVGLSESLFGQLYYRGINVSVVLPSYINTGIWDNAKIKFPKKLIENVGLEKLEKISEMMLHNFKISGSNPNRVVRKYIKDIKDNKLYITDTKMYLSVLTTKGTPEKYEELLKTYHKSNIDSMREYYSKLGVNYDDYF